MSVPKFLKNYKALGFAFLFRCIAKCVTARTYFNDFNSRVNNFFNLFLQILQNFLTKPSIHTVFSLKIFSNFLIHSALFDCINTIFNQIDMILLSKTHCKLIVIKPYFHAFITKWTRFHLIKYWMWRSISHQLCITSFLLQQTNNKTKCFHVFSEWIEKGLCR